MKKIFVGKDEFLAELVERIINDPENDIVLVVPKNAALGQSVSNFHLLKREADASGKNIFIESVDEEVLALAKASHLEAAHPLLSSRVPTSAFSDIISSAEEGPRPKKSLPVKKRKAAVAEEPAPIKITVHHDDYDSEKKIRINEEYPREKEEKIGKARGRFAFARFGKKRYLAILIIAAVLISGFFAMNRFFSRATVFINFEKQPWVYGRSLTAGVSVSKIDADNGYLPAELFTADKNLTQFFPASGSNTVSLKAGGKLTIYNAYSSKPQSLVAATRFETPDGKIFRITDAVIVPGAQIKDGKIIPSSIEANLAADKPGPDYNVGPVARLTIPGFKGTPKYGGFYGELKNPTSGGFIGKKAVPTADDIQGAKDKTTEILKTSLTSKFLTNYPSDFKILGDASAFSVTRLNVNQNTDDKGNFSVFGEASIKALGFRESDLKSLLLFSARKDHPNYVFDKLDFGYSQIKPDLAGGSESFYLSANGSLKPDFSADDFKREIAGKKIEEARSSVSSLEGLSSAKISLWPIWLKNLPADAAKISVLVN